MIKHDNAKVPSGTRDLSKLIWLTTKEAAEYLRIFDANGEPSDGAIRTAICRGMIKAGKWGRTWRIKRANLDLILESSLV